MSGLKLRTTRLAVSVIHLKRAAVECGDVLLLTCRKKAYPKKERDTTNGLKAVDISLILYEATQVAFTMTYPGTAVGGFCKRIEQ